MFEMVISFYVKDLEATSEANLCQSPGGQARTPLDFTFEAAFVIRRSAKLFRGETPEPWPYEDTWATCPPELASKEKIIGELKAAAAEFLDAYDALGDEKDTKTFKTPMGERTVAEQITFAAMHTNYHDGQLNYLQALLGDKESHWF